MDSFDRFNETKLPEKEKYYSIQKKEHITDEEYEFAKKMMLCCWQMSLKASGILQNIS